MKHQTGNEDHSGFRNKAIEGTALLATLVGLVPRIRSLGCSVSSGGRVGGWGTQSS